MVRCRSGDFDEFNFDDNQPTQSPADANYNPATPGYNPDVPSPQGPYTPQTPGSTYSPYANPAPSPGGGGYQGKKSETHHQCL